MALRRLLTVGISAFALLLGSCVTNSASIYIAGVVQMELDGCILDPGGSRLAYSSADVGGPDGDIIVAFVVQNLIQQRNFNVMTDVSTVLVDEAEITLSTADGATIQSAFIVDAASGVVPGSGDGVSPGEGVVLVPLIPAGVVAGYADIAAPVSLIASVTLRGRTNGDIEVEGGPFSWTVILRPRGSLGLPCAADFRSCCARGQDGEAYCTDVVNGCTVN